MIIFIALFCGLLFGLGLIASGMTDPGKIQGFLDVTGSWDPSLAFVMGAAVAIGLVAFGLAKRRERAWSGVPMALPTGTRIDAPLVGGGLLFGIGWGLAGYCPGPALVALGGGSAQALWFVVAMLVGMVLHDNAWARRAGRGD